MLTPHCSLSLASVTQTLPPMVAGSRSRISAAGMSSSDAKRWACSSTMRPPGSASPCMIK